MARNQFFCDNIINKKRLKYQFLIKAHRYLYKEKLKY